MFGATLTHVSVPLFSQKRDCSRSCSRGTVHIICRVSIIKTSWDTHFETFLPYFTRTSLNIFNIHVFVVFFLICIFFFVHTHVIGGLTKIQSVCVWMYLESCHTIYVK